MGTDARPWRSGGGGLITFKTPRTIGDADGKRRNVEGTLPVEIAWALPNAGGDKSQRCGSQRGDGLLAALSSLRSGGTTYHCRPCCSRRSTPSASIAASILEKVEKP